MSLWKMKAAFRGASELGQDLLGYALGLEMWILGDPDPELETQQI